MRIALFFACGVLLAGAARAERITLSTGEVLTVEIIEQTDQGLTVAHPVLGQFTLGPDQYTAIAPDAPPAQTPPADEAPAAAEPAPPAQPPKPTGLFADWQGAFEAGFAASRGNSETLDLRLGLGAKKETDRNRWAADAAYYFSSDQGDTSKNEFTAGLLHDWLIPDSRWFYFAQGRYEFDELEAWEQRISGTAGVGYQWIDTDKLNVRFRAGAGGNYEFGDVDAFTPEAQLGGELAWQINDTQSLEASTDYLPDLGDFPEARIRSAVGWKIKLDQFTGLSLKMGLENEYETQTQGDAEHNDLKVFSSLVYEF